MGLKRIQAKHLGVFLWLSQIFFKIETGVQKGNINIFQKYSYTFEPSSPWGRRSSLFL